jgi:formamidopyrimidine-DNA glycosylase
MPELPEVETVRAGLARLLPGKAVLRVKHDWPKSFPNAPADTKAFLIGASILGVERRGKALIINLDTGYSLVIHMKMTGQLVYRGDHVKFGAGHPSDSLVGRLPDKSTRVTFDLSDRNRQRGKAMRTARLFFNDQRKFGWVRLLPTVEVDNIDFFRKLGPDPLAADFTAADFVGRLKRRANTSIKAALLDQTVIAGVGNIYADEALWGARIHPATLVKKVSTVKLKRLLAELQAVLLLSIEKGGSTDRNYVDAEGRKGSYLSFAKVFRRTGQPCPRCGTPIQKIRVAGRGTHICPHCQKSKIDKKAKA